MGFKCGIVGLPNVGKSTLFNALTRTSAAAAANYPFCTIEPNVGEVPVPDERLGILCGIAGSKQAIAARLTFVDIAGLVRGASKGEGLGNQFLANIREVDAVAHVLRCFEDDDITHVEDGIDPVRDALVVETELMLADLDSLEKRAEPLEKKARSGDREARQTLDLIEKALTPLRDGRPARTASIEVDEKSAWRALNLLTTKPVLYVCNVSEGESASGNEHTRQIQAKAAEDGAGVVIIAASIEAELARLEGDDHKDCLASLGLEEPGLNRLIRAGYNLLDLITYFTAGPKETRAWTITNNVRAPRAAAAIHTDFEKGFIRAQTIAYDDYVSLGGEAAAKEAGKARDEGKDYIVRDGDVLLFRFNV